MNNVDHINYSAVFANASFDKSYLNSYGTLNHIPIATHIDITLMIDSLGYSELVSKSVPE